MIAPLENGDPIFKKAELTRIFERAIATTVQLDKDSYMAEISFATREDCARANRLIQELYHIVPHTKYEEFSTISKRAKPAEINAHLVPIGLQFFEEEQANDIMSKHKGDFHEVFHIDWKQAAAENDFPPEVERDDMGKIVWSSLMDWLETEEGKEQMPERHAVMKQREAMQAALQELRKSLNVAP